MTPSRSLNCPDDATAARLVLGIAGQGNLRTETMKAYPEAEYRKIVGVAALSMLAAPTQAAA